MSEYVIATGSTCDLDAAWLNEHHVPFISYTFTIDGKDYADECHPDTKVFVKEQMDEDHGVTTAAVSLYSYEKFFESILKEGKDIIFMDMCKALTSSYNNSLLAAKNLKEKYPERKIEVIDTNCVTLLLGILLKEAVTRKENGASFEEIVEFSNAEKNHITGRFMVNDLKWLRRGGRLSNASAIVGSLLSIKPLIVVDDEGKLVAYSKVRGHQKCRKQLLEDCAKNFNEETGKHEIALVYSGEDEDGQLFKEEFMAKYPQFDNVNLYRLGPVIMGHIGPGFLAVVAFGSSREA